MPPEFTFSRIKLLNYFYMSKYQRTCKKWLSGQHNLSDSPVHKDHSNQRGMHSNEEQKCLLTFKKNKHSLQIHPRTFHLFSDSPWLVILIPIFIQLKIVVIVFCYAKWLRNCLGFVVIIITEDFPLTEKHKTLSWASKQ